MLQNSIGLPYPVQMHFDIVFGTSSGKNSKGIESEVNLILLGALTACALYINNWPIEKCIDDFERSSRLAFKERRILSFLHPLLERMPSAAGIVQFAISLLVDSVYSADSIERVHREIYGPSRSIVNSQATAELGAALGVTLTSVDDVNTFIVTNYNGIGERRIDDGRLFLAAIEPR
jgi:hypothetical protein